MQNIKLPNNRYQKKFIGDKNKWKIMAEDVRYHIDESAQILIIFLREEHADSEGAILTAEKDGPKITGLGSSAEPHSDRINQH